MVRGLLEMLHKEIRGLHEAAYLLAFFALLSQILALIRDRLLAGSFGAGETLDIYYASFRLPDLIFVGIASVVSIYVLIPFLSERSGSHEKEQWFIDSIFTVFFAAIAVTSSIAFLLAPLFVEYFFPGLVEAGHANAVVLMTRLLLLQPILLGLSNLFGSITQTRQRFLVYAISPLLYNLGIIVGILFLYPDYGFTGLAGGVLLGALLHVLIQFPFVMEQRLLPKPTVSVDWNAVRKVVALSLPRTLTLSAHHLALLFVVGLASVIAAGSIAVFQLAYNLQAVPLAIIGVSYSVAAFPTLARFFTNGEREAFVGHVVAATRHILFWSLPITALFIVLRAQIVRVILGAGVFGWAETRLTAAALALFTISLAAQNLSLLFVRGYYASGNTRKPLIVNLFSAVLVVVFSFGFYGLFQSSPEFRDIMERLLRVEGIPGTAVLMLPLGYSLALIVNTTLLWILFQQDFSRFFARVARTFRESLGAAILMGTISYLALDILDDVFNLNTFWGILLQGLLAGLCGILAGLALLAVLQNAELKEAMTALKHKFWRTPAVAPEAERLE